MTLEDFAPQPFGCSPRRLWLEGAFPGLPSRFWLLVAVPVGVRGGVSGSAAMQDEFGLVTVLVGVVTGLAAAFETQRFRFNDELARPVLVHFMMSSPLDTASCCRSARRSFLGEDVHI